MEFAIKETSKNKLSLTRVLREIKSLDIKIKDFFESSQRIMVSLTQGVAKKTPYAGLNVDDLTKKIQADHDELNSLIERRFKLKQKLIQANATTKITVGDREYSIAEAIELKNLVPIKELVLKGLRQQLNSVQKQLDKNDEELRAAAQSKIEAMLGDKDENKESRQAAIDFIMKNQEDSARFNILDPKNIRKRIEQLETEVSEIKNELDYKLSEINSTTFIEVD